MRWTTDKSLTPSGVRTMGNSAWPQDISGQPQEAGPGIAAIAFDTTGFRHLVVEVRREGGGNGSVDPPEQPDQVSFNWKTA
jgi:hypothetical protein